MESESKKVTVEIKPLTLMEITGAIVLLSMFLFSVGGICYNIGQFALKYYHYKPWQIVCSPDGRYSYTDSSRKVWIASYATESEAVASMTDARWWYDHRKDPEPEREADRRRKWRPCE